MDTDKFTISGTGKEVFKALFNAKKLLGSTVAPEGKNPHFGNDYIQLDTLTKKIDPVTEKNLKLYWSEDDIVEIMGVIALFGYLNRWNDVMGTTIETDAISSAQEFLEGIHWDIGKHT